MFLRLSKCGILCPLKIATRVSACKAALAVAIFLLLFSSVASANNIVLANSKLINKNALANTIQVQFDLSWDNAWRDADNYDAAWVFGKYCLSDCADGGTGTWHHMTMKGSGEQPDGFVHGVGDPSVDIIVPSDKKGVLVQLQGVGTGTVSKTGMQFVWDYGADGVSDTQVTQSGMKFRLFAIEMVYIPEGSFTAGDGYSNASFGLNGSGPWSITSEDPITTQNSEPYDYEYTSAYVLDEASTNEIFTIPAAFPKGYGAFYLMKYEISQGQYVRFLNTLTRTQQQTRVASDISGDAVANNYVMANDTASEYRNTIQCPTTGNGTSPERVIFNTGSRDARAASYISWMDLMAYADWAGLRPMTELEFEKAARGPEAPVAGEYAWGTTNITQCDELNHSPEDGNETCVTGGANCNFNWTESVNGDGGMGPLRVGIFATGSTDTREKSGAGYYGNLDLSGNEDERTVTVGNAAGRAFTGTHGDGTLSTNGNADVPDWPGYTSGEVTGADGAGARGNDFGYDYSYGMISERGQAAAGDATRFTSYCGRLARTAP